MMHATSLAKQITEDTVLGDWFQPMDQALQKTRFSDQRFSALPMKEFILFGCFRQIQAIPTLRETIQSLHHINEFARKMPVARSTLSDALSSSHRRNILVEALHQLVLHAQACLPDKLAKVEGLGNRPVIATDATYQKESSHYRHCYPAQGGTDNKKGHQHLTHFDMRAGIPLTSLIETQSMAEIRLLKKGFRAPETDCMRIKSAIHVVDRAFIDAPYWDKQKSQRRSTVITRMKSNLNYTVIEEQTISDKICNQGVISAQIITLESSNKLWRLIEFMAPDGTRYQYLSNDFDLVPGVIAFLYHRRWDIEKYFDNYKHDMANVKAWGKRPVAIEQQSLLAMVSYILMRLFIEQQTEALEITLGDTTQQSKHRAKQAHYRRSNIGVAYRAFYTSLSKITCQMWRFIKYCFAKKSALQLYERQFKPLMMQYL